MAQTGEGDSKNPNAGLNYESSIQKAKELYGYIDSIFLTDDELKQFLYDAVLNNWTPKEFATRLTNTKWYIANGQKIQARGFQKRQYEELVKDIDKSDSDYVNKVKNAAGNTDYWRGLDTTKKSLRESLTGKGITFTESNLDSWSAELYDLANENNTAYVSSFLNTKISFSKGGKETGAVATNLSLLREYAVKQGFDLTVDYSDADITSWMQRLDRGDSIEAIKKEIEVKATIGQPESVKNLMKQGLTVSDIYSPYVKRYNAVLQKTNGTMKDKWFSQNIFDDKGELIPVWKTDIALKKHEDWEFTDDAREEVSNMSLKILRDFGLQG